MPRAQVLLLPLPSGRVGLTNSLPGYTLTLVQPLKNCPTTCERPRVPCERLGSFGQHRGSHALFAAPSINPREMEHLLGRAILQLGMDVTSVTLTPKIQILSGSSLPLCSTLECLGPRADGARFEDFSGRGLKAPQELTFKSQVSPGLESGAPWPENPGLDFTWAIAVLQPAWLVQHAAHSS